MLRWKANSNFSFFIFQARCVQITTVLIIFVFVIILLDSFRLIFWKKNQVSTVNLSTLLCHLEIPAFPYVDCCMYNRKSIPIYSVLCLVHSHTAGKYIFNWRKFMSLWFKTFAVDFPLWGKSYSNIFRRKVFASRPSSSCSVCPTVDAVVSTA